MRQTGTVLFVPEQFQEKRTTERKNQIVRHHRRGPKENTRSRQQFFQRTKKNNRDRFESIEIRFILMVERLCDSVEVSCEIIACVRIAAMWISTRKGERKTFSSIVSADAAWRSWPLQYTRARARHSKLEPITHNRIEGRRTHFACIPFTELSGELTHVWETTVDRPTNTDSVAHTTTKINKINEITNREYREEQTELNMRLSASIGRNF